MLRMTRTESGPTTTIQIEGKILGPWVSEVRSAVDEIPKSNARRLDMAGVSLVDASGAQLILQLQKEGVEVTSCSHFVADLLAHYRQS